MKILMVTTGMHIGGAETHITELCLAFKKRGISVTVASSGGVGVSALEENGITHITLPLDKKTPSALLASIKGLAEHIRREKFDIVHAHARIPAFICGMLRKSLGFRFVTTDHLDFKVTPLLKKLTDWGELTFVVSEDLRGYLTRNYKIDPDRLALTVNGINTQKFSPREINQTLRESFGIGERTAILHVSRLEKHLSLCVRALMGAVWLLNGEASLIVAGDGTYAQELKEEAEHLNRSLGYEAAVFVGAVTDVESYIAASDIVVSPSRAAMEAMACGKPTIVCGSQGYGGIFSEAIADQAVRTNFCFRGAPLPDPSVLARDIDRLIHMSESEKSKLCDFGRRFICDGYSADVMTQTQLEGYEGLLKKKPSDLHDILICGYYGYGNMGDETILSVLIEKLRAENPHLRLCVLSASPKQTKRLHNVDTVARFDPIGIAQAMDRSKILLFGAGNLLQNKTSTHSLLYYTHILHSARKRGLKILIYANGIGPLHGEENKKRTEKVLRLADSVSLRELVSFEFAQSLRLQAPVRLTFDPAILAEREDFPIPCANYFVVAPKKISCACTDALVDTIRSLREKTGLIPVLVSLYDKQDAAYVKRLASQTNARICFPKTAGECITLFSSARLVISSRLHALVYATAASCPMMAYSDDEKLFSYLDHIGFGASSALDCRASASGSENVALLALKILGQSEYYKSTLSQKLPEWRALAQGEIHEIISFFHHSDGET
jgi:polysaccharide pyruvyl transferase CsaB